MAVREKVLVVDDEPSIREVTQKTLERHGYQVLLAGDGPEALAVHPTASATVSRRRA